MTAAFISSLKLKAVKILKTPSHYPCSSTATLRRDNADPASHEIAYTSGVQCLNDWLQTTEFVCFDEHPVDFNLNFCSKKNEIMAQLQGVTDLALGQGNSVNILLSLHYKVQMSQLLFFFPPVWHIWIWSTMCKQGKNTWMLILSDRFRALFICGNKSNMNQDTCISICHVSRQIRYTILPKVLGHPLLMKGLTTLVISKSTNLTKITFPRVQICLSI